MGPNEQKLEQVRSAQPGALRGAARSWDTAAEGLAEVERSLSTVVERIKGAWEAESAELAAVAFTTLQTKVGEYEGKMRQASNALERGAQALAEGKAALASLPGILPMPDAPEPGSDGSIDVTQEVHYLKLRGAHASSVQRREEAAGVEYQKLVSALRDAQSGMHEAAPEGEALKDGGGFAGAGGGGGGASSSSSGGLPAYSGENVGAYAASSGGSGGSGGSVGDAGVVGAGGVIGATGVASGAGLVKGGSSSLSAAGTTDGITGHDLDLESDTVGDVAGSAAADASTAPVSDASGAGGLAGGAMGAGGLLGGAAGASKALGGTTGAAASAASAGSRTAGSIGRVAGASARASSGVLGGNQSTTQGASARAAGGSSQAGQSAGSRTGSGSAGRTGMPGAQQGSSARTAGSSARAAGGTGSRGAASGAGSRGASTGAGPRGAGASGSGGRGAAGSATGRGPAGTTGRARDDETEGREGLIVEDDWLEDDEAGPGVIR